MITTFDAKPMDELLENRQWLKRRTPFPHVLAYNVFRRDVYQALETAFLERLQRGLSDDPADATRFSRNMGSYDAYSCSFHTLLSTPLRVFVTRRWHDMLAGLAGVEATGDVDTALHHHRAGSANGTIHNDLNPGWFVDGESSAEVNLSDMSRCNYHHGTTSVPGLEPRETVRAVAMLYYLANPVYSAGDGGETGLYRNAEDPVDRPAAVIPPINNTLVIFECTPYSYHVFLSNRRHPRNSLIMWLHRAKAEVVSQWGEDQIMKWT